MNSPHGIRRHDCCDCKPAALYSRRGIVIALASSAMLGVDAPPAAAYVPADDERFMRLALDEARQGDYPFGAVIVRDGEVIARGRNLGKASDDPTAHGEMVAIRRCLADRGSAALRGSALYTSGEPCAMCMGAILWSRVGRLVFAASVQQLATKIDQIMVPTADIAAKAPFAPIAISAGVLADEAMKLFDK
ncbi:MAG TPA: nucleoside deaminase [Xanthobacteraceae bacterium]|nr:nucleoside deaminase [Xanthobacteraceae bacterium]